MNWRWLILGIVLTSFFALIQLPTRFVLPLLPNIPAVTLLEPTGSVWHGGVCARSQMLPEKACVQWHWQARQVFSGRGVWDVNAQTGNVQSALIAGVSADLWQVNGALTVPAGQAIPQWAAWLPAGQTASEKKVNFSGAW